MMKDNTKSFNEKANAIRSAIDTEVSHDDLDGLTGHLLRLTSLVGLSCELKARAIADKKRAELVAYATHKHENLQPSVFKIVIEGECADEYAKLELADRLNAGLTHVMEGLRTIISLRKEEMKNSLIR